MADKLNLLIVDDEAHVVDWIYDLLDGQRHLPLNLFKAGSGVEAVNLIARQPIHIVLSDIRMPKMSGLRLMELVLERQSACRFAFLTGHSQFDYVYAAIQHPGVRYLLKTEDDERIVQTVEEMIQEIEKARPKGAAGEAMEGADVARRITEYIAKHLGEDLSLNRLSALVSYNPSYLSRAFKRMTGENLNAYITRERMERARQLLTTTRESVLSIAALVGFDSAQYFATAFKRHAGVTPQAYREGKGR